MAAYKAVEIKYDVLIWLPLPYEMARTRSLQSSFYSFRFSIIPSQFKSLWSLTKDDLFTSRNLSHNAEEAHTNGR